MSLADLTPQRGRALYAQIDRDIDECIGSDIGFTTLLAPRPFPMSVEEVDAFRARHATIRSFQEQALALFKASLRGDADPEIAGTVLDELPAHLGSAHHASLTEAQHRIPAFFRTDELPGGKLSEIQCSGSGWGLNEQIHRLYADHEDVFGPARHFPEPLSAAFAAALREHLGGEPAIHHLVDNASRPHGVRYFIQRTREQGLRYFSYDRDVGPGDCNFVRSHDWVSLLTNNFHSERMERCDRGELRFDLSPSCLFDAKVILAWPFWSLTREHFSDAVRELLPHTAIVHPSGLELEDGERTSFEAFLRMSNRKRAYYLKYAGTDVGVNWGSRAVFATRTSAPIVSKLLERALAERKRGRPWILQRAHRERSGATLLDRSGEQHTIEAHIKYSAFYGPGGLLAIQVDQMDGTKVHGTADTIKSIVH